MIYVGKAGYSFGADKPAPVIPGFRVTAKVDEWTQAQRGNLNFIVRETPTHWIMERYGKDLWGRNAERQRRARHRARLATRNAQEQSGFGWKWKMPAYSGEHIKGCWSVDSAQSIAVRKPAQTP